MITKKTVFVLGAGASMPYGFPSGAQLRQMLCAPTQGHYIDVDWGSLIAKKGVSNEDALRFSEAFLNSGVESIDSFLSRRSKEFGEIGKLAIAAILCSFEEPSALRKIDNDDDWYRHLWNALVDGVHECGELSDNQVRFVTFNYDRSLEYFFVQSCRETFGVTYQDAVKAIESLKIIHVYGQLGKLDQQSSIEARPYETRVGAIELSIAANGIKIIPESRDDALEFDEARELFSWAEQICFLGFGFDSLNVSRLNLESVFAPRRISGHATHIVASTHGKTEAEITAIQKLIPSSNSWWKTEYGKNLKVIRNSGVLL